MSRAALPPPLPAWPAALEAAGPGTSEAAAPALGRIRALTLFWPATRARATNPRALVVTGGREGPSRLAEARARFADAEIAAIPDGGLAVLAGLAPDRLEAVWAPPAALALWARIGGLAVFDGETPGPDPLAVLGGARGRCPWTGRPLPLDEAIEAQALLRAAAMRARGPLALVGMTRWKRRCLRPFLTGPDGPPRPARGRPGEAGRVVWGVASHEADRAALRVEDGFLRSVGLGLRHTPPLSLAIAQGAPHFDATQPNSFEETVARADFDPALLARAARLRARVVDLGLTKYNLDGAEPLPPAGGRLALFVPGQVATDASIRLGAATVRDDLALLQAARARFPDAFLIYKPHPDVVTGLRGGAAPAAEVARLADAMVTRADAAACLGWADRVATMTSLIGFEALLRGRAVTTFGRPFYAGWGLTDDADPPARDRTLSLDALTAAALILYPSYVDPRSGLPAPPEIAIEALAAMRRDARRPAMRLRRLWRNAASFLLARL